MNCTPSFHTFSKNVRRASGHSKSSILSEAEETRLVNEMHGKNGESTRKRSQAREKLILAYTPLAKSMAYNAAVRGVVSRDDLESEARLALTMAVDKFDPERGARIATPAGIEIRSVLMRYVMDNSGPTRLGTNLDDKRIFMGLRKKIRAIELKEGRPMQDSDLDAIAEEMGVKVSAIKRMMPRLFASDTTVSGTDAVAEDDSGNQVTGRGGVTHIATSGGQEEREVAMDLSRVIRIMENTTISKWTGRNRDIILAFVRGPCSKSKLDELADKYDISVERVRQIQREGREFLKNHLQNVAKIRSMSDISV